ncbi:alternative ribosome rescue aminoacyl-tRNA hydrolase ArfB [Sphingobacterium sp. HJSM2_6]|uniref:alternative ribosome rescue aminoacyl-tRNA hydrolase ArfB n=1 Tax=Sphingobacterium sp. HJSM2_6 TaxID=3366264 RepID=UPI003BE271E1
MNNQFESILTEVTFKTARSGGKGGQHVNKVSSKVHLIWNIPNTTIFNDREKELLFKRLSNRLTKDGSLLMVSDEDRSQLKNKEIVLKRFMALIADSLIADKPRIPTKIPKSKVLKRLDRKKKLASKKADRKWKPEH